MPDLDPTVLLVAIGMAGVTYGYRFGGLLLGDRLPKSGRWAYVMARLPAIIVVALVTSGLQHAGWQGWIAAAATVGLAFMTPGLLIPMGGGVAAVALLRMLG